MVVKGVGDQYIFTSYSTTYEALGVYRILFCTFTMFVFGIRRYWPLREVEAFIFNPPPGIARMFGGFPDPIVYTILDHVILLCLLLILVGWKTRVASILYGIAFLVGHSLLFSQGKINHNEILQWIIPIVMSHHWGRALSIDSRQGDASQGVGWPVAFIAMLLGFGFFAAGVQKFIGGWLSTSESMFQGLVWSYYFGLERQDFLTAYMLDISSSFF